MCSIDRCCTSDSASGKHHCVLRLQSKTTNLERDRMERRNVGKGRHFIYFLSFNYLLEGVN